MPNIRGGILGWNIDLYSTRTDQFDWSVSRAYVINTIVRAVDTSTTVFQQFIL